MTEQDQSDEVVAVRPGPVVHRPVPA